MTIFSSVNELREIRNTLLKKTDVLMVSDLPLTPEEKTMVIVYRQNLRDLPSEYNDETVDTAVLPVLSGDGVLSLLERLC